MRLHINKEFVDGVHVLHFDGELDLLDSRDMPAGLQPFTKKQVGTIVLDLSHSSCVDSQWLAVFIRFHELMQANGNELYFLIPEGTVRELFITTGLSRVFTVIDALDEVRKNSEKL